MRYHDAMRMALSRAQAPGTPFDVLIDISGAEPLPQDVAVRFERVAADMRRSRLRRVAFVSTSALPRIQAKRITSNDTRFRTFADEAAGLAWLRDGVA